LLWLSDRPCGYKNTVLKVPQKITLEWLRDRATPVGPPNAHLLLLKHWNKIPKDIFGEFLCTKGARDNTIAHLLFLGTSTLLEFVVAKNPEALTPDVMFTENAQHVTPMMYAFWAEFDDLLPWKHFRTAKKDWISHLKLLKDTEERYGAAHVELADLIKAVELAKKQQAGLRRVQKKKRFKLSPAGSRSSGHP
jgi:hypothetical protein